MAEVIPYEVFKEKQRERKYGTDEYRINRLKAMNYDEDLVFASEDEGIHELFYGETEEDEDYWLGERDLTRVIR